MQNKVLQKKLERVATTMVATACLIASRVVRYEIDPDEVVNRTTIRWEGRRDSSAIVLKDTFALDFALHDLGITSLDTQVYYHETTALAREAIPPAYVSVTQALCNLVAHELSHLFLFLTDARYGGRGTGGVHNQQWLDLMLYLRDRLSIVFCFCPQREWASYSNGEDRINLRWSFLNNFVRASYIKEHKRLLPLKKRAQFGYIDDYLKRLVRANNHHALFVMSERMSNF